MRIAGNNISFHKNCVNYYSDRKAARVKFWVAFANSSLLLLLFFFCVAIGQEITHKTLYMTK